MNVESLTYLAGYFDGRGCIHCRARQRYKLDGQERHRSEFHVAISGSTHRELLDALHRAYGGFVTVVEKRNQRPVFTWRVVSESAARFLRDIRPHARLRGAEIDLALEFYATIRAHGHRSVDFAATRRRQVIEAQMAMMKKRRKRAGGA